MIEKRNAKLEEMKAILSAAQTETRAFTPEEETKYSESKEEIRALDETIKALEEAETIEKRELPQEKKKETVEEMETRAFETYIRGQINETRSGEQNVTMGNNGAVIPVTIAKRIIKEVTDICPILARATMYHVKGTLKIPVWGKANDSHDIAVGYQAEFTELTADAGKFTSVDLEGYLAGALTLIGVSVINNADVDVVGFIVSHMAEKIAEFLEKQLLVGDGSSKAQGITYTTNKKTAASGTAITADELIDIQAQVKQAYQGNACWIMHSETFTAIKKLKDGNNRYLLQDDITGEFPYRLLGKPVFLSDNMPKMESSAKAIVYGDLSALSVNFRENIEIKLLQEKYATQHAVGVVAWFEFDSKVTEHQKVAVLEMGA
ncbi:phage major capsid protein [Lachnospiraceae bacterium NSJ-12]|uniref:Phage major capsid protein n=2 Tax=Zhenhengia yiwuensis TaxID=2763666 RepID=A0A926IGE9_9FIRM|nr:phage major capsid protein [Zhenhengia yiwuensis]